MLEILKTSKTSALKLVVYQSTSFKEIRVTLNMKGAEVKYKIILKSLFVNLFVCMGFQKAKNRVHINSKFQNQYKLLPWQNFIAFCCYFMTTLWKT